MAAQSLILITGGSGFVSSHCIVAALRAGYAVRTTVRSLKRQDDIRGMLKVAGVSDHQVQAVDFAVADLLRDDGWLEACKGCTYVLHVASPFPSAVPKNPDDLIKPARDGTMRVLKAARKAGTVRRVVLTSSFAAIGYGHSSSSGKVFTEGDWTNLENPKSPVLPYPQSKTIAEREAWTFIENEGTNMELTVVNPGGIFGPTMSKSYPTSLELIVRLLKGWPPFMPHMQFPFVDVRDVADLHLLAMSHPKAAGQRYLCLSDEGLIWTKDIAGKLRSSIGHLANRIPTWVIPNVVIRLIGWFDQTVAMIVPDLGKSKRASNAKAKTELGWQPRSVKTTLIDTAKSLEQFGLLK